MKGNCKKEINTIFIIRALFNFYVHTFVQPYTVFDIIPQYNSFKFVATFVRISDICQRLLISRTPDGRDSSDVSVTL